MFNDCKTREKQFFKRCNNFVGVSNESNKIRYEKGERSMVKEFSKDPDINTHTKIQLINDPDTRTCIRQFAHEKAKINELHPISSTWDDA